MVVLADDCEKVAVWPKGESRKDIGIPGCESASIDATGQRVAALVTNPKDRLVMIDLPGGATHPLLESRADQASWIGDRVLLTYGSRTVRRPSFVDARGNVDDSTYVPYNSAFIAASADGRSFVLHRREALGSWLDFYHSGAVKRVEARRPREAAISGETVIFVMEHTDDPDRPPTRFASAFDVVRGEPRDLPTDVKDRASSVADAKNGFVLGYEDGHVALIAKTFDLVASFPGSGIVVAVAVSPDQTRLAALHEDGAIVVVPVSPVRRDR